MGNRRDTAAADPVPPPSEVNELRAQVVAQAPSVYITLVSVLIGLVLSDLVSEARARMHLWPLDYLAIRTWGELIGIAVSAVNVWAVLAHLAMARRRVPDLLETVGATGAPLLLLIATSFVGRDETWPWLYATGVYLTVCGIATTVNVHMTMDQPGAGPFDRLLRLRGFVGALYFCSTIYLVAGLFDQLGVLPRFLEMAMVLAPVPASVLILPIFFRDWRAGLVRRDEGSSAEYPTRTRSP